MKQDTQTTPVENPQRHTLENELPSSEERRQELAKEKYKSSAPKEQRKVWKEEYSPW